MMQYMGGKYRLKRQISDILKSNRFDRTYLEPFVGGAWILNQMDGKKIACDINPYLITMYQAIQNGWIPPEHITKEMHNDYKRNKPIDDPLTGFIGFCSSYRGVFFSGYNGNSINNRNYLKELRTSLLKYAPMIQNVDFRCCSYSELEPKNNLIYCDPPYAGTEKYNKSDFDSNKFWQTMRLWRENNTVIISEYNAPNDFECIAEFPKIVSLGVGASKTNKNNKLSIEKLFI